MAKWCVFYSSITGNTHKLAEVAADALGADIFNVNDVLDFPAILSQYDCVMVGYWLRRGAPDLKGADFLPKISGKKVALFQTHGAYEGSEHTVTAFARAGQLLGSGNTILGTFSCQAAVSPALIQRRLEGKVPGHRGEDLEACKKRWADAANHPDEMDFQRMRQFARRMQAVSERL